MQIVAQLEDFFLTRLRDLHEGDFIIAVVSQSTPEKKSSKFISATESNENQTSGQLFLYKDRKSEQGPSNNQSIRPIFVKAPLNCSEDEDKVEKAMDSWMEKISSKNLHISGILYLHPILLDSLSRSTLQRLDRMRVLCEEKSKMTPTVMLLKDGVYPSEADAEIQASWSQFQWSDSKLGVVQCIKYFDKTAESITSILSELADDTDSGKVLAEVTVMREEDGEKVERRGPIDGDGDEECLITARETGGKEAQTGRIAPNLSSGVEGVSSVHPNSPHNLHDLAELLTNNVLDYLIAEAPNLMEKIGHDDVQLLANYLDLVLDQQTFTLAGRRNSILTSLSRLAVSTRIFPQHCILQPIVYDANRVASGGFGDVHQAIGRTVCVKVMKEASDEALKSCVKELTLWSRLSHPNILPFFGIFLLNPGQRMCLVSPWMNNGNLSAYAVNLPQKDRMLLLSDVADGLEYLHNLGIVHSDIKGQNVLVSNEGRALITDFGISHIATDAMKQGTTLSLITFSPYFAAPEELDKWLDGSKVRPEKPCDIWSFGCLCYEILTRRIPFEGLTIYRIRNILCDGRMHPLIATNGEDGCERMDNKVWLLIVACWTFNPLARPDIQDIRRRIAKLVVSDDRPIAKQMEKPKGIKSESKIHLNLVRVEQLMRKFQSESLNFHQKFLEMEPEGEGVSALSELFIDEQHKTMSRMEVRGPEVTEVELNQTRAGRTVTQALKDTLSDLPVIGQLKWLRHRKKTADNPEKQKRLVKQIANESNQITENLQELGRRGTLKNRRPQDMSRALKEKVFSPTSQATINDTPIDLTGILAKGVSNDRISKALNLMTRDDIQLFISYLDSVLDEATFTATGLQNRILTLLSRIAVSDRIYPEYHILQPIKYDTDRVAKGNIGTVHQALNQTACVKVMNQAGRKTLKLSATEMILWLRLSHPNILPFFGVFFQDSRLDQEMCLVSPWMNNGNLTHYSARLSQKDRMPLLSDVADGLAYLHQLDIVHGGIKGQNVLVTNEGRALITDVGVPCVVTDIEGRDIHPVKLFRKKIMAPEILKGSVAGSRIRPEKPCDIWSFGCLCYEVLARELPFKGLRISDIIDKQILPARPSFCEGGCKEINDEAWALIFACWAFDPLARPDCQEIRRMVAILVTRDDRPAPQPVKKPEGVKLARKPDIDMNRVEHILHEIQNLGQKGTVDE